MAAPVAAPQQQNRVAQMMARRRTLNPNQRTAPQGIDPSAVVNQSGQRGIMGKGGNFQGFGAAAQRRLGPASPPIMAPPTPTLNAPGPGLDGQVSVENLNKPAMRGMFPPNAQPMPGGIPGGPGGQPSGPDLLMQGHGPNIGMPGAPGAPPGQPPTPYGAHGFIGGEPSGMNLGIPPELMARLKQMQGGGLGAPPQIGGPQGAPGAGGGAPMAPRPFGLQSFYGQ